MEPSKRPPLRFPASSAEKPLTALQRLAQESAGPSFPKPIRSGSSGTKREFLGAKEVARKRELESAMDLTGDNVPPPLFEPPRKERRITKLSHVKGSTPQRLSRLNGTSSSSRSTSGLTVPKLLTLDDLHRSVLSVDFADVDSTTSVEIDNPEPRLTFDSLEEYQQRQSQILLTETMEGFRSSLQSGFVPNSGGEKSSGLFTTVNVQISTVVRKGRDFCLLTLKREGEPALTQGDVLLLLKPQHPALEDLIRSGFIESVTCSLNSTPPLFGIVEKSSLSLVADKGPKSVQLKCPMASASFPFGYSPSDAGTVGAEFTAVIIHSLLTVEREWRALCFLRDDLWFTSRLLGSTKLPSRELKPRPSLTEQLLKAQLNVSQRAAVEAAAAAAASTITAIQGPPGTGKTHTLVTLLVLLKARGVKRVIVCAPSNAAVDELMLRFLIKTGGIKEKAAKTLRIGRNSGLVELKPFSLDQLVMESQSHIENERYAQYQQRKEKLFADIAKLNDELASAVGVRKVELNRTKERVKQQLDQLKERAENSTRIARDSVYEKMLGGAQFLFGTLSAFGSEAILSNLKEPVDVCVIDEAAQAIEVATLIPFQYKPARVVLVGDPQQLPAVVKSTAAKRARFDLSLMERLELSGSVRSHLLREQYRMDPAIAIFPSLQFYEGRLVTAETVHKRHQSPVSSLLLNGKSLVFIDTASAGDIRQGTSMINPREGRLAADLARLLVSRGVKSIGIISPYRQQVMLIRNLVSGLNCADLEVDSVDAFQGREKEVVIFSCVRSGGADHSVGFLADQRRLNVAITRAKNALWLIGNVEFLNECGGAVWSNLIRHCKEEACILSAAEVEARLS
jgi:senataxin